jgi:hypothetical protein
MAMTLRDVGGPGRRGPPIPYEAVLLQELEPHLAEGRERRHRVPEPAERHLAGDRDGRGMQQLRQAGTRERRADDDAPLLVDDELRGAGDALAERRRA